MTAPLDAGRLRLLREVSLRGSIAAAAREVGLTPSAVSQQLATLERQAGQRLLDRSPRGVVLTGAGQALVARAKTIAEVLEQARADLDRLSGSLAGTVRIGAVASAAATVVSAACLALNRAHPQVRLTVKAAEPAASIAGLLDDDLDIAVVDVYDGVPLAVPDFLRAAPLLTEPLVALVPAADPAAGTSAPGQGLTSDKSISLKLLSARLWVMPPETAACGQAVRFACRRAGFEPEVSWETDDMLLLARAVAQGHGVAVLPALCVIDPPAGVQVRALTRPALRRKLITLTRSGADSRAVVEATLQALGVAAQPPEA